MMLPAASSQTWQVACTGFYDQAMSNLMRRYVRPRSLVCDIGASLGLHAVPLAMALRDSGVTLIAFEPVPGNADFLRSNINANGLASAIELRAVALGDTPERVKMSVEGSVGAGNAAITARLPSRDVAMHSEAGGLLRTVDVVVTTLDQEMSGDPRPCSLLKLDVEGYEFAVLRGGRRYIANHRPVIIAEFSEGWMLSRGVDWPAALWRWTDEMRYGVHQVVRTRRHRWSESEQIEVTALPRGSTPNDEVVLLPIDP